jgi:hypothetical protein
MTARRNFYLYMALTFGLVAFAGFAPTYFLRAFSELPPLSIRAHVHGALFTAWVMLFVAQAALVRADRRDLHRPLGVVGAVLSIAMIGAGLSAVVGVAARFAATGFHPHGLPPAAFLAVQLGMLLQFAAFVALAIGFRRRADVHKRLMLLATVSILPPAVARFHLENHGLDIPNVATLVAYSLLFIAAAYDFVRTRRVHAVYVWGGPAMLVWLFARVAIGRSEVWQPIARWLID